MNRKNRPVSGIKEYFRLTGELTVALPALKRPTLEELREKYRSDEIISVERDISPEEPITLVLGVVPDGKKETLPGRKDIIDGKVFERCLAAVQNIPLGKQHMQWLLERQDEFKLASLPLRFAINRISFPGIVIVSRIGGDDVRFSPQIYDGGDNVKWRRSHHWLSDCVTGWSRVAFSKN